MDLGRTHQLIAFSLSRRRTSIAPIISAHEASAPSHVCPYLRYGPSTLAATFNACSALPSSFYRKDESLQLRYGPSTLAATFNACSALPSSFYRKDKSLPSEMRYYDGRPPEIMKFGTAWQDANFETIDKTTEVAPGVTLIALVSDAPGTRELRELSLAINTADGIVLLVGCSHPGIEKIVEAAAAINPKIHLIAGGFHLVVSPDDLIAKAVAALKDTFKVENVAPGHCTGEPTFAALKRAFGEPVHLCRGWRLTAVGIEHGRRRATWRGAGTRLASLRQQVAAFHEGLKETGFVEGQNATVEYRSAEGRTRSVLGAGLRSGSPSGGRTCQHPRGTRCTTMAVLINPNFSAAETQLRDVQEAAARLSVQLVVLRANVEGEFDAAFANLASQRAGALLVCGSPFFNSRREQLVVLAARHAVPAIYEWRDFAAAGGLMSYGTNLADAYRQAAVYVGRIIKGAKPADLPVVQGTRFEFVINLNTAKALGLEVPPGLSARADEIT